MDKEHFYLSTQLFVVIHLSNNEVEPLMLKYSCPWRHLVISHGPQFGKWKYGSRLTFYLQGWFVSTATRDVLSDVGSSDYTPEASPVDRRVHF